MDSAAVLTDQQRLLRFRKVIEQKKFRKNLKVSKTERKRRRKKDESSASNLRNRVKEVKAEPIVDPIIFASEPPQLHEVEQQHQQPEPIQQQQQQDLQLHKLSNSTAALQRKIETIVKCHEITFVQTDDIFFQKLDNISEGDLFFDITREDFLSYVKSESENFRSFALQYKYVYLTFVSYGPFK